MYLLCICYVFVIKNIICFSLDCLMGLSNISCVSEVLIVKLFADK